MDEITRSHPSDRQDPLERLEQACRQFGNWRPALGSRHARVEALALSASRALGCDQPCLWIDHRPATISYQDITLLHDVLFFTRHFTDIRSTVSLADWCLLREKMGNRFYRHGQPFVVSTSILDHHVRWFGIGNKEQLNAVLEDVLLGAFCLVAVVQPVRDEARITLFADLVELWLAGTYPIGISNDGRSLVLFAG